MANEVVLKLLLDTFLKMVELKACAPGEHSHMLAHHTEFIRRQIGIILKRQALEASRGNEI